MGSPVGRPRSFEDSEAIAAATRAFRTHGYGAATPQLLADAVGIGKGSLYNAFGTKHQLFITCLQRYADDDLRALTEQLGKEGADVRSRVRAAFEAAVGADQESPDPSGCMIVGTAVERGPADREASEIVARSLELTRRALRAALAAGAAAGEIEPGRDLDALTDVLQCSLIGLRVVARAGRLDASGLVDSAIAQI